MITAGTGKSHVLVALGVAAVEAGHKVRFSTAAELVETLYRALADNSVGRIIDALLRHDLIICDELGFAPQDDTAAQLLFRFVALTPMNWLFSETQATPRSGAGRKHRWSGPLPERLRLVAVVGAHRRAVMGAHAETAAQRSCGFTGVRRSRRR